MTTPSSRADSSGAMLASYYDRHMALVDGVAYGWVGRDQPRPLPLAPGQRWVQSGVSRDAYFALQDDGQLWSWSAASQPAVLLMRGVARFAAGASGWFAIDRAGVLWHASAHASATTPAPQPQRVAEDVIAACIGDSADYYITRDGRLFARGLAHRGQYGDGKLTATPGFVATATDAVAVKAHTGHAIHLRRDGAVMGTGGNRFGPLSSHGLGDKADRWGLVFEAAVAVATGSRHSLAIRADGSLWAWGEGFAIAPSRILEKATAVAAGDTATIALTADGTLWQWDGGGVPRRLSLPPVPR